MWAGSISWDFLRQRDLMVSAERKSLVGSIRIKKALFLRASFVSPARADFRHFSFAELRAGP